MNVRAGKTSPEISLKASARQAASRATFPASKTRAPSRFVRVLASAQPLNIPISDPIFWFVAVREVAYENPCRAAAEFSALA